MKVLIVGAGKLGFKIAESIVDDGIDITMMDIDPDVLERVNEHIDLITINANGIDIEILKEIGIEDFDLLIAVTNNDETNTLICSLGKKLGCERTIARIRNPAYMEQLDFIKEEMGIDYIVNPDLDAARTIERYLLKNFTFHLDEFVSGRVQLIEMKVGSEGDLDGRQIKNLKGFDDLLIAYINKPEGLIIPNGDTIIDREDIVYIMGKSEDIEILSQEYGFDYHDKKLEEVMILGGSNIGYYLAKNLSKLGISVRIVEKDMEKAKELSEQLDEALIIHGDGTDFTLLEEEELENMDAFIGTTGFDEMNLLMALMAKQAGVGKTIAKISRKNYGTIIDRLDIDLAINPIYITASKILKYIRGGKVLSVSLLLGSEAEVNEVIVHRDSPYINIPLKDLKLAEGIIIGAIFRKNEVIIPKGDSIIKPKDRIVVFSLSSHDGEMIKDFFKPNKGGILSELWHHRKSTGNNFDN